MVLGHDRELDGDYAILAAVLESLGVRTYRIAVGRVPVDGAVTSARSGDWRSRPHGGRAAARGRVREGDSAAVRLGLRLYFIGRTLGRQRGQSFRPDLLEHSVRRARHLIDTGRRGAPTARDSTTSCTATAAPGPTSARTG